MCQGDMLTSIDEVNLTVADNSYSVTVDLAWSFASEAAQTKFYTSATENLNILNYA